MAGPGRPFGSVNVRSEKPFGNALRMELAAAGDSHRELRLIDRNLITLARAGEPGALQAIREIRTGRSRQGRGSDPKPDPLKLN